MTKVEITFLYQWRVGVRRSLEGGWQRGCKFNASISDQEGRLWDKALLEYEVEITSLSWLYGKEM
jgi:hypothetical protein